MTGTSRRFASTAIAAVSLFALLLSGPSIAVAAETPRPAATGTASPSASLPLTAGTVSVSGSPSVGATLTASVVGFGPAPVATAYQWLRGSAAITGATGAKYTTTAADAGATVSVRITVTKSGYAPLVRTSAGVAVARVLGAPSGVTVSGTGTVGSTLTAAPGTWAPAGVALGYQWLRSGIPISGATARTYRLVGADAGAAVSVRVTGTKAGYTSAARASAPVRVVATFSSTPKSTISGTAASGRVLTVNPGTWQPAPAELLVQWRVDGNPVEGATGRTWEVPTWVAGRSVSVSVTANRPAYRSATATSAAKAVSWSLGTFMPPGTTLRPGVRLTSPDGRYAFGSLGDGNVALTRGYALVRTARTTGALDGRLTFTTDGELLLLDQYDVAMWSSRSGGLGATGAVLGNDGVLRLIDGNGDSVWTSAQMAAQPDATAAAASVPGRFGWAYPLRPTGKFTTYSGHSGDDISAPTGTPVYTMRGGKVSVREVWIRSGCPSWAPNKTKQKEVVVTSTVDGTRLEQVYAHLSAFSVKTGQTVAAGQRIGAVGSTGCSTGPHLHTAFTVDGVRYSLYPRDVLGTATY
ncbi:peptidoglycan DD-metalloendopeptidase family protein [Microbacterium sp. MM2322]|uniref:peptidoglycan DD-metalloendopeptidase family protein n=1 Tax=Microbacterium sp. MM2322 TaxID=3157631 RepID=UPI0032D57DCC